MAHLVGASLSIPGSAWNPEQEESTDAQVVYHVRATRGYPQGRVRILCEDGTDVWWDVAKLPQDWVKSMPNQAPTTPTAQTPSRTPRRSAAAAPAPGTTATPGTTGRLRASSRSRRASRAAADGYDSSGGLLSEGEGAAAAAVPATGSRSARSRSRSTAKATTPLAAPTMSPAAPVVSLGNGGAAGVEPIDIGVLSGDEPPATGVRQRGRQRKSLRFAPGTHSPGGAATAAVSATPRGATAFGAAHDSATAPSSPLMSPRAAAAYGDISAGLEAYEVEDAAAKGFSSEPPPLHWTRRVRNTVLIALVTLPALYFFRVLQGGPGGCSVAQWKTPLASVWANGGGIASLFSMDLWCALGYQQPLLAVNLMFFLNIDVLFWAISLLQGSTWLIDPFWQIAPMMIGLFYQFHPLAVAHPLRSRLAMGLLWIWAVRMTHSYFRREEWQVGAREDWRYARMAQRYGRRSAMWALVSFFAVGVTQQLMLVGITLPLLAVHSSPAPWNPVWDTLIFLVAAAAIMTSLTADNQLRVFMLENQKRRSAGLDPILLLDTGLWRYSRHPNFFGEQLWWWALASWAVLLGQPWMVVGAAFNTLCFFPITWMTEARMLERSERRPFYQHYMSTTSMWVPWPPKAHA
ncbi:hypothetical protein CHLRE_07g325450v5 [Chlamydomonas reinhardtii]|uniref:Steroid 5-alpha reductase C-terminal domain-containing protein n=1 Tax=Chlamydomonas reinhardtii TaxID=3055 RepID=A0A2K3DJC3_CHLRE|nr:uncharacterized protein CHLRE_07g325450v5 [Chlamydomonas reinhardtii]PNW80625.1 hypothetical protein CHLRE_07g325450v5 [Chlamydomonas reinhardtii]